VREAELMNLSQNEIVNKLGQFNQSLEENKIEYSIPNRMDNSIPPLNTIYIPNSPYNTPSFTPNATPTSTKSEPKPKSNNKGFTLSQSEIQNIKKNLKRPIPIKKKEKEIEIPQLEKELTEQINIMKNKNKKENPIIPLSGEPNEEKIPVNKYEDFHKTTVTQLSKIYSQLTGESFNINAKKAEIINKLEDHRQKNNLKIDNPISIDNYIEDLQYKIVFNKLEAANKKKVNKV
jgi:hypothetical protein